MSEHRPEPQVPGFGEMPQDVYATYRDERNRLTDAERDYAKAYDKYIITLSGGAIALSIALLRDLVGSDPIRGASVLVGAWISLLLAVGMSVFGLFLSPISHADFRRVLDEQAQKGGAAYWSRVREAQGCLRLPKVIQALNIASVFTFLVGLLLLLSFAYGSVKTKGLDMNTADKNMLSGIPADKPLTGSRGPATAPVDRVVTIDPIPPGKAGSPPPLGPVDRVPGPTTPAAPSQPTSSPAEPQTSGPPPSKSGK